MPPIDSLGQDLDQQRHFQKMLPPNATTVYFSAELSAQVLSGWLESLAGLPVLTVSEDADFVEAGGIIGLVSVGSRYQFDINLGNARRGGLRMRTYLLKLARTVK